MPANNRLAGRDVHIHDSNNPTEVLGGLILTNGVTNANLYAMINIIVEIRGTYFLRRDGGTVVPEDNAPLSPGNYYIVTTGSIFLSEETWIVRAFSHPTGTQTQAFRDAVRSRDRRCVLSGEGLPRTSLGIWIGYEAAHIFPLGQEDQWIEQDYGQWITKPPAKGGLINSVQNGLLLRRDIHQLFDSYMVSINPDDNYKVMFFTPDEDDIAGRKLDQEFVNNPDRPVDQLLQLHFRQAVLANMRGAGEPVFEHDFPPGSDMVGEIMDGPMPAERMQFELFSRLGANEAL